MKSSQKLSLVKVLCGRYFLIACLCLGIVVCPGTPLFARTRIQTGELSDVINDSATAPMGKVDIDKSVIIMDWRTDDITADNTPDILYWAARFSNITIEDGKKVSNRIHFKRRRTTGSPVDIRWFVVESDAFQVEYIETIIAANQLTKTIDLTNKTQNDMDVDFVPDKCFVIAMPTNFLQEDKDAYNAAQFTTELIYNTAPEHDQLKFTRQSAKPHLTTDPCAICAFVVKMRDDSVVYQGSVTVDDPMLLAAADIKNCLGIPVSVDRSKAIMFFDKNVNYSSLHSELRGSVISANQVAFNRRAGTAGSTDPGDANVHWYVLELGTLGRVEAGEVLLPKGSLGVPYTYPECTRAEYSLKQPADTSLAFAVCSQDSTGSGHDFSKIHRTVEFIESGKKLLFHRDEGGEDAMVDFFMAELKPMRLFTPNGGEMWQCGNTEDITWYAPDSISNVEILLSNNGGANYNLTVTSSTANDGVYEWEIPHDNTGSDIHNFITGGADLRIKVRDVDWDEFGRVNDTWSSDSSDANFEIIANVDFRFVF